MIAFKRKHLIGTLLVILGALLLIGIVPVYKLFKNHRAEELAEASALLFEEGKWDGAANEAQAALHLNPELPSALRIMAHLHNRFDSREAFEYWERLGRSGDMEVEDALQYVALSLRLEEPERAEPIIRKLFSDDRPERRVVLLGVQLKEQSGDIASTVRLARKGVALYPESSQISLQLARILVDYGDAEDRREAKALLQRLLEKPDLDTRAEAGQLLIGYFELESEDLECFETLRYKETEDSEERLLHNEWALRLFPDQEDEIVREIHDQFELSNNADLIRAGRILNRNHLYSRSVDLISREVAVTNWDLLAIYLDAMAGLDRWEELREILDRPLLPVPNWLRELYRTRLALALDDSRHMNALWNHTLALANDDPAALFFLGEYMEKLDRTEMSMEAYSAALNYPSFGTKAGRRIIRMAEAREDTDAIRRALKKLVALYPNAQAPRNDLLYVRLLLEENVQRSIEEATERVRTDPAMFAFRTTLALAYLRNRKFREAAADYAHTRPNWRTALPSWKAVYAAVLESNGNWIDAKRFAQAISLDRLKPEERKLIANLL